MLLILKLALSISLAHPFWCTKPRNVMAQVLQEHPLIVALKTSVSCRMQIPVKPKNLKKKSLSVHGFILE